MDGPPAPPACGSDAPAKVDPSRTGDLFDQRFFFELLRLKGHDSGKCSITLTTEYRIRNSRGRGTKGQRDKARGIEDIERVKRLAPLLCKEIARLWRGGP
jgi:hypothetical protein